MCDLMEQMERSARVSLSSIKRRGADAFVADQRAIIDGLQARPAGQAPRVAERHFKAAAT